MGRRLEVLELAILGVLIDSPMHGYQIRKVLREQLGVFRALSYGTLYPTLRALSDKSWIEQVGKDDMQHTAVLAGERAKVVYQITPEGKDHFHFLMSQSSTGEDNDFSVRFAFFSQADAATRLRIMESRRARIQERLDHARHTATRTRIRWDDYTQALHQYGLDSTEREVRWLTELIDRERTTNMTHLHDGQPVDHSADTPQTDDPHQLGTSEHTDRTNTTTETNTEKESQ